MARMPPAVETVDDISESTTGLGEIGRVNLRDVAEADNLGARTRASDESLHLFGR